MRVDTIMKVSILNLASLHAINFYLSLLTQHRDIRLCCVYTRLFDHEINETQHSNHEH